MNAASNMPNTVMANMPDVEEDGTPLAGMSYITLHTSKGEMVLEYDPSMLELDHDIGILCSTLQSLRNFGMLNDAVISMHLKEGTINQFKLSEIKITQKD